MTPAQIRSLRISINLTQEHFAQLLGVHSLTVSKWERGLLKPQPYHQALMGSFFKARERTPDIGDTIANLLVGADHRDCPLSTVEGGVQR